MNETSRIEKEINAIHRLIMDMGRRCAEAVSETMYAFAHLDKEKAKQVIEGDKDIDSDYEEIEKSSFRILLLDHPVARDFRALGGSLKMITDLERIGDYCVDIAEEVLSFPDEPLIPDTMKLIAMGNCVSSMVEKALESFEERDVVVARGLAKDDDRVDRYFEEIKQDLIEILRSPNNTYADQTIIFMMVAKYLERMGDHAVNIGEWVDYSTTGSHLMS
ncbi:MAG: phosphate signaling complex protein PhoU [Candidatus Enteromonas sp.]|nr:phosphate signaling complex protein PhoU [Candidatus Enteromonas sp.]